MRLFYLFFLSTFALLGPSPSHSFTWPILSTNTGPLIQVGGYFRANCSYPTFHPPNRTYKVSFDRDGQSICRFVYPDISMVPVNGTRKVALTIDPHHFRDFSLISLNEAPNWAELFIAPKTNATHTYRCTVDDASSNKLTITQIRHLPSVHLSVNQTKAEVGVPLKATCSVANYSLPKNVAWNVAFHSAAHGVLGSYTADLATLNEHANLSLGHGSRSLMPVFDLEIVEHGDGVQQEFWCTLEVQMGGGVSRYSSIHWPDSPVVSFYSGKPREGVRQATCEIGNWEADGREFSVQFWTSLGPEKVNRLGKYIVQPHQIIELDLEESTKWAIITAGPKKAFPTFTLLATSSTAPNGTWWCSLGLGAEGSPEYREITSIAKKLA